MGMPTISAVKSAKFEVRINGQSYTDSNGDLVEVFHENSQVRINHIDDVDKCGYSKTKTNSDAVTDVVCENDKCVNSAAFTKWPTEHANNWVDYVRYTPIAISRVGSYRICFCPGGKTDPLGLGYFKC